MKGVLHSYSLVERAPTKAFIADTGYYIGLVDLDEGFRIMTNIQSTSEQVVEIGAPIEIFFENRDDLITLPQATIVSGKDS